MEKYPRAEILGPKCAWRGKIKIRCSGQYEASLPQKVVTSAVVVSVQLSAGSGHVGGRPGGVGTYLKQKLLLEDSVEQVSRPIESSSD